MTDPVLDTLCLPLLEELVDLPTDGPALFLRARRGDALDDLPHNKLLCEQSFKPAYDALERTGFLLRGMDDDTHYGLVMVLPPRQREESRALLARAVQSAREGGIVMAAVSNLEGAKTIEGDLKALCGSVTSLSKNKCRVFWAHIGDGVDRALVAEWRGLDAPRVIEGGRFVSRPGLFAWDHFDPGSKLLADNLPVFKGVGADLGAGFGYLSDEILRRSPEVTRLDVYEAEDRALELARVNLAGYGERVGYHWRDVTKGIEGGCDFIVSNPPFHVDRADRHDLGKGFIRAAAAGLKTGGALWMVANRHLPYEETLKAAFKTVVVMAQDNYFKVFKAIK